MLGSSFSTLNIVITQNKPATYSDFMDDETSGIPCLQNSPKGQTALGTKRTLVYDKKP